MTNAPNLRAFWSRLQCLLEQVSEQKTQWPGVPATALNCTHSWGPSQPSNVAWAIPVGLALLTAKDADQSLCQHNFTAGLTMKLGHLNCPTRTGETGYMPTRDFKENESNVHMRRDTGRSSEMEKIGFHFLLVLVRRQAAVFCCWWFPGLVVFYRWTLQQQAQNNKVMAENCPWHTLLLPQAPSCTSTRSSLVILGESSLS